MNIRHILRSLGLISVLVISAYSIAFADSGPMMPANVPKAYTQECAACHTAYAPGMLPKQSWLRILTGLDKHYGTDATLDDATVKQLSSWLQANAGTYKRVADVPPNDRITQSAWFVRKHRAIEPSVWKLSSVKSASNCTACHTSADKGIFDDDNLQIPVGIDARSRRAWNN